jgi:sodium transport system permease protein
MVGSSFLHGAAVVIGKEIVDALRDRRSLVSASTYALLAPLAVGLALHALARDRSADRPLTVSMTGAANASSLVSYLRQQSITAHETPDAVADVRTGQCDVAIVVTPKYGSRFRAAEPAPVELVYDGSRGASTARADRLRRAVSAYSQQVMETRLLLRGILPDSVRAIDVHDRDVSSAAGRAVRLLAMLPIFLLVAAFTGGMSVAIDATAGERERGSLESLLLQPVSPGSVVLGKWVTAAALSAATVALMIAIVAAVLALPQLRAIDLPIGLSWQDALALAAVLFPLALLAPALQMLVSLFATSYKEAQTQVSLLLLLPTVPGFLIAFGSMADSSWLRMVPIVAQQLLASDVLSGQTPGPSTCAGAGAVTALATAVTLGAGARLIAHERIVQGQTV